VTWILGGAALLVLGIALLGWLGYRVVRKGIAVAGELGDLSARLAEESDQARAAFETRLAAPQESVDDGTAVDRAPLTSRAGLR